MPRPSRPWFRFYVETVHDRKIRTRPPAQRWLWVVLLSMARSSPEPGVILIAEGMPADEVVIADEAGLSVEDTKDGLTYFESLGMIDRNDIGAWFVASFLERQFESDTSTERTAKNRSQKNNTASQQRLTSVSVLCSFGSKERISIDDAFARFWAAYPRKDDKIRARSAFDKALKKVEFPEILAGAERLRDDPNLAPTLEGGFIKMPSTWLNAGAWGNGPLPSRNGFPKSTNPTADRIKQRTDRLRSVPPALEVLQ